MKHYQLVILGDDPLALPLIQAAACQIDNVAWITRLPLGINNTAVPTGVDVLTGDFEFLAIDRVVCHTTTGTQIVSADQLVLATGARPHQPRWMIEHPRVFTGDQSMHIPADYSSVTVVGAGRMGQAIVAQLEQQQVSIEWLDARDNSAEELAQLGFAGLHTPLRSGVAVIGLQPVIDGVAVYLDDGHRLETAAVVVCCGQRGNTESIHLPAAGLTADDRGRLWCNENLETWTPGIFALGDVVGYPHAEEAGKTHVQTLLESLTPRHTIPFRQFAMVGAK